MNGPIAWVHQNFIHTRRVDVLAAHFADLIRPNASVLDIGCGDGQLAAAIIAQRPDIRIRGIDVLVRDNTAIEVTAFDGRTIPFDQDAFDTAILVDVLHHAESAPSLLAEAARVASKQIVIKDHYLRGFAAQRTLAFMDRVGNQRHGVDIPCNYLTEAQWDGLIESAGLRQVVCREKLRLYLPPLCWFFERGLHFVASLESDSP
jgi:SAM-dependent methyltransferase